MLLVDPKRRTEQKIQTLLDWDRLGFAMEYDPIASADPIAWVDTDALALVMINMEGAEAEGMDICARIRENSRIPIILVGGSNDFEFARKALYHQVNDYLPNPVSADELAISLQNVTQKLEAHVSHDKKALPSPPAGQDAQPPSSVSIIEKVKEYVDETLHQSITLKEISNVLHFNCSYLGQKFKVHENMTFNEYLLRQRMERAKYLLEHTDMKVYEIASEVGYSEMDWFYKKFKTYTGVSANEYRKMSSITA
jgi:two-component system, response regulator YesN